MFFDLGLSIARQRHRPVRAPRIHRRFFPTITFMVRAAPSTRGILDALPLRRELITSLLEDLFVRDIAIDIPYYLLASQLYDGRVWVAPARQFVAAVVAFVSKTIIFRVVEPIALGVSIVENLDVNSWYGC